MVRLRYAAPRFVPLRQIVPVQYDDLVEVVGERAGRQQPAYTAARDHRTSPSPALLGHSRSSTRALSPIGPIHAHAKLTEHQQAETSRPLSGSLREQHGDTGEAV